MKKESINSFVDHSPGEAPVRGMLHRAASQSGDFLVLTHGASGNMNAALLVALAEEFAGAGISVLRCDLPYRQRRPIGPPSPATAKEDQEGLGRAIALMKEQFKGRAFLGGSSYGGRQASLFAATHPAIADGLLLLSYPLHPPGKPSQLRTSHFPELRVSSLFVSGTKDSFGTIQELTSAIELIPARTELVPIDGASHGLSKSGSAEGMAITIKNKFREFFS
jgi:predicted alpha/beta-hydrolase family hydrolase